MEDTDRSQLEGRVAALLDAGELEAATTEIVRGYGPDLLRFLYAMLEDEDAAAEVFAELSEDLWRGIRTFRRASSVRTWVYRVAWNAARMYWRDAYRRRARPLESSAVSQLVGEVRESTRPYLKTENRLRFEALKQQLRPEERSLLVLRIAQKLSWREIAEVLAAEGETVDERALRKRYERLKARLRKLVAEGSEPG